ncbi:DNA mismatch repair endonuclease MutL [Candidatus Sumerlaeota bacterium]|nr:DNA mismatch repair endonuclease MutL [Candidatus Sumerlaeota bacterium]
MNELMRPQIQVLPQTLINKIAAGEVIVRPASVVKETVENAFDAAAHHIRVEVDRDARSITVVDDGCGMDGENAKRAILRHSTSKIREFDDLMALVTRGFRGEALASIVSVSRFEMLTRLRDDLAGVRLVASGGRVEKVESVGAPPGTTIRVRDLFYNTPARLKFLKSPAAEFGATAYLLMQQALSHPEVGMRCAREDEVRFDLPPDQDLRTRMEELLGSAVRGKTIEVDFERHGVAVRGFVSRPEANRKDRKWLFLMVNGRPIAAKQLAYPIQDAYAGLLMKQRFPIVVLDIRIDPREVDVNVHPTKEEVRFEEERKVAGVLHRAVSAALASHPLIPNIAIPSETGSRPPVPRRAGDAAEHSAPSGPATGESDPSLPFVFSPTGTPAATPGGRPAQTSVPPRVRQNDFVGTGSPIADTHVSDRTPGERDRTVPCSGPIEREVNPLEPPPNVRLSIADGPDPIPLGQIGRSYIAAEWGDDLLLIDQHAAHERLIYQRLTNRPPGGPVPVQPLLVPIVMEVAPDEIQAVESLIPLLSEMGIEMCRGEGRTFEVGAVPSDMDSITVEGLVRDVLDDLTQGDPRLLGVGELRDRVRVRMACRAAIKAGQALSEEEIARLVSEIVGSRLSFTCPHGRPTMVLLKRSQLDLQFGRR